MTKASALICNIQAAFHHFSCSVPPLLILLKKKKKAGFSDSSTQVILPLIIMQISGQFRQSFSNHVPPSKQGFSASLQHKALQSSSLLLAFNFQAALPLSHIIIHSPILALLEETWPSIQSTTSVADDAAVTVSSASMV